MKKMSKNSVYTAIGRSTKFEDVNFYYEAVKNITFIKEEPPTEPTTKLVRALKTCIIYKVDSVFHVTYELTSDKCLKQIKLISKIFEPVYTDKCKDKRHGESILNEYLRSLKGKINIDQVNGVKEKTNAYRTGNVINCARGNYKIKLNNDKTGSYIRVSCKGEKKRKKFRIGRKKRTEDQAREEAQTYINKCLKEISQPFDLIEGKRSKKECNMIQTSVIKSENEERELIKNKLINREI